MEIRFNKTGAERKELVEAISQITGWASVYMKAPTFGYVLNNYTVDKEGTLHFDERTEMEDVRRLLEALADRGFVSEDSLASIADSNTSDRLTIEVPLEGFSDTALSNLEKLVASKATLIKKAIGALELPITQSDGRLCFPWFAPESSAEEVDAYTRLIHGICTMAKEQKRVVAKEKPAESEKFAFRCFLLRLGFIGSEFASARKILLANLPGNGSSKGEKRKTPDEPASEVETETATEGAGMDSLGEVLADAELVHAVHTTCGADAETATEDVDSLEEMLEDEKLIHALNTPSEAEGGEDDNN